MNILSQLAFLGSSLALYDEIIGKLRWWKIIIFSFITMVSLIQVFIDLFFFFFISRRSPLKRIKYSAGKLLLGEYFDVIQEKGKLNGSSIYCNPFTNSSTKCNHLEIITLDKTGGKKFYHNDIGLCRSIWKCLMDIEIDMGTNSDEESVLDGMLRRKMSGMSEIMRIVFIKKLNLLACSVLETNRLFTYKEVIDYLELSEGENVLLSQLTHEESSVYLKSVLSINYVFKRFNFKMKFHFLVNEMFFSVEGGESGFTIEIKYKSINSILFRSENIGGLIHFIDVMDDIITFKRFCCFCSDNRPILCKNIVRIYQYSHCSSMKEVLENIFTKNLSYCYEENKMGEIVFEGLKKKIKKDVYKEYVQSKFGEGFVKMIDEYISSKSDKCSDKEDLEMFCYKVLLTGSVGRGSGPSDLKNWQTKRLLSDLSYFSERSRRCYIRGSDFKVNPTIYSQKLYNKWENEIKESPKCSDWIYSKFPVRVNHSLVDLEEIIDLREDIKNGNNSGEEGKVTGKGKRGASICTKVLKGIKKCRELNKLGIGPEITKFSSGEKNRKKLVSTYRTSTDYFLKNPDTYKNEVKILLATLKSGNSTDGNGVPLTYSEILKRDRMVLNEVNGRKKEYCKKEMDLVRFKFNKLRDVPKDPPVNPPKSNPKKNELKDENGWTIVKRKREERVEVFKPYNKEWNEKATRRLKEKKIEKPKRILLPPKELEINGIKVGVNRFDLLNCIVKLNKDDSKIYLPFYKGKLGSKLIADLRNKNDDKNENKNGDENENKSIRSYFSGTKPWTYKTYFDFNEIIETADLRFLEEEGRVLGGNMIRNIVKCSSIRHTKMYHKLLHKGLDVEKFDFLEDEKMKDEENKKEEEIKEMKERDKLNKRAKFIFKTQEQKLISLVSNSEIYRSKGKRRFRTVAPEKEENEGRGGDKEKKKEEERVGESYYKKRKIWVPEPKNLVPGRATTKSVKLTNEEKKLRKLKVKEDSKKEKKENKRAEKEIRDLNKKAKGAERYGKIDYESIFESGYISE